MHPYIFIKRLNKQRFKKELLRLLSNSIVIDIPPEGWNWSFKIFDKLYDECIEHVIDLKTTYHTAAFKNWQAVIDLKDYYDSNDPEQIKFKIDYCKK